MTVILHTDTALYTAFLVRPREIPTAGFFPFKEEETEALRGGKVASAGAEVGPELWLSLLLCRCPQGDAQPLG